MTRNKLLTACICLFFLVSCASLMISKDARQSFEQGLALFNQGKYEDAIAHFTKATETEPEYTDAFIYTGRSYLNLGQWFEAIPPLRTAYSQSPSTMKEEAVNFLLDALVGGALEALKKGNFKDSIGLFKEALDIDPYYSDTQSKLIDATISYGSKLLAEGDFTEAVAQFKEAVKMAPNNLDAYYGLVKALFEKGDLYEGVRTINKALKAASTEEEKAAFKDRLK